MPSLTQEKEELVTLQKTLYTSKNPTRRWLHCSRRDWLISKITQYAIGNIHRSLEVGPGSGVYIPTLAAVSTEVTVSDVESAHLNYLRMFEKKYPNLKIVQDNIKTTKLAAASFEFILCSEVIEHIYGSQEALHSLYRLLKPNGILILSTPQKFSTLEMLCKIAFLPGIIQIVRIIYQESILKTGHINLMTKTTLKRQIAAAGFRIVEEHQCGLYLPLLAECLGETGLSIEKSLETVLRRISWINWLLWTQCYVLRKEN